MRQRRQTSPTVEVETTLRTLQVHKPDTGFFVAMDEEWQTFIGVAVFVPLDVPVVCVGDWREHRNWGRQFFVHEFKFKEAQHVARALLMSGFLKGIKAGKTEALLDAFGDDLFAVLDACVDEPDKAIRLERFPVALPPKALLQRAKGVGPIVAGQIISSWNDQRSWARAAMTSTRAGLSLTLARRAYALFGHETSTVIRLRPYSLTAVKGVTWERADDIAQQSWPDKTPIPHDSPGRYAAALRETLRRAQNSGHTCLPEATAYKDAIDLADPANVSDFRRIAGAGLNEAWLVRYKGNLLTLEMFTRLMDTASKLHKFLIEPQSSDLPAWETIRGEIAQFSALPLSSDQIEAVKLALTSKISVITGGPGTGKCHGAGTMILMYDGTTKAVENIRIGDRLIGPDSKPRTVTSTTCGQGTLYQVEGGGHSYTVNEDHILCLAVSGQRYGGTGHITEISVRAYVDKAKRWKHHHKGFRESVNWSLWPVPIDPYWLGLWLGDGSALNTRITTADDEVVEYLERMADEFPGLTVTASDSNGTRCPSYALSGVKGKANPITENLRRLGIFGNKDVPLLYRRNHESVRLHVLAGLIDSDGCLSCGGYEIVQKSDDLADSIVFLARSLGFAINKGIKKVDGNKYHRMFISGDVARIPVKIARKQAPKRRQKKNVLRYGIKIERLGHGMYYGFELAGTDGRYLLDDFSVTHNTTVLGTLTNILSTYGVGFTLCAPTGKAARRMSETTHQEASTIHRALGIFGTAASNRKNSFDTTFVFVDEMSMTDAAVFAHVVNALPRTSHLVMIGDVDQLPPVGYGEPFHEVIKSGVPTARLTTIHRQGRDSGIVHAAHAINHGLVPEADGFDDFKLGHIRANGDLPALLLKYLERILEKYDFELDDIQIMTTVNRREWGQIALNEALQERYNPGPRLNRAFIFKVDDRVIQTHNNYKIHPAGVMNGEIGRVAWIATDEEFAEAKRLAYDDDTVHVLSVDFGGSKIVSYDEEEADDLALAYALTVHKSQGSEYAAALVVLPNTFRDFMTRQLAYTAVTRAKRYVLVLSAENALRICAENTQRVRRFTCLSDMIIDERTKRDG